MTEHLVGNAFLVEGGAEAIPELLRILKSEGVEARGNPDVYVRAYARFGIEEAREARERAVLRPAQGKSRYFLLAAPVLTGEAQNALLKTLEEPPADAVFFLVTPAPRSLLPTLRSRMQPLLVATTEAAPMVDAQAFLAASPDKRITMLAPLLEKDEDDKRDLRPILSFFASLEQRLSKQPEGLRTLYRARKFIGDKGALLKPLLEEVALLMPRV